MKRLHAISRCLTGGGAVARLAVLAACLSLVLPAWGASGHPTGIVLQLGGIEGESRLPEHEGWIPVLSFGQALDRPQVALTPGSIRPPGGLSDSTITFAKGVDKASPKIAESVCKGTVIPRARFEFFTLTDRVVRFYQVALDNVLIHSYAVHGPDGQGRPVEQISLNFEKIEWTYTEFAHDGKPLADHRAYWDFVLNQGGSDRTRRGFKVSAGTETGRNGVRLRWLAESGRKYRILRSDLINGRFTQALPDVDSAGDIEQELWMPREGPFGFFIITEVDPDGAP